MVRIVAVVVAPLGAPIAINSALATASAIMVLHTNYPPLGRFPDRASDR